MSQAKTYYCLPSHYREPRSDFCGGRGDHPLQLSREKCRSRDCLCLIQHLLLSYCSRSRCGLATPPTAGLLRKLLWAMARRDLTWATPTKRYEAPRRRIAPMSQTPPHCGSYWGLGAPNCRVLQTRTLQLQTLKLSLPTL